MFIFNCFLPHVCNLGSLFKAAAAAAGGGNSDSRRFFYISLMDELFLAACDENGVAFCNKYIRKQFDVNVRDVNGCTGIMKVKIYIFFE